MTTTNILSQAIKDLARPLGHVYVSADQRFLLRQIAAPQLGWKAPFNDPDHMFAELYRVQGAWGLPESVLPSSIGLGFTWDSADLFGGDCLRGVGQGILYVSTAEAATLLAAFNERFAAELIESTGS